MICVSIDVYTYVYRDSERERESEIERCCIVGCVGPQGLSKYNGWIVGANEQACRGISRIIHGCVKQSAYTYAVYVRVYMYTCTPMYA